jgi:hypothetical protein
MATRTRCVLFFDVRPTSGCFLSSTLYPALSRSYSPSERGWVGLVQVGSPYSWLALEVLLRCASLFQQLALVGLLAQLDRAWGRVGLGLTERPGGSVQLPNTVGAGAAPHASAGGSDIQADWQQTSRDGAQEGRHWAGGYGAEPALLRRAHTGAAGLLPHPAVQHSRVHAPAHCGAVSPGGPVLRVCASRMCAVAQSDRTEEA